MVTNRKIRVGIIGANPSRGFASIAHIPALQALADFEISAVCTTRQDSADAAARHYGVPLAFCDAEKLARHPDVDLVAVSVKVPDHYLPVMAAIEARKHVYCEWPLGRNTDEAARMRDAANRKGIRHAVGLPASTTQVATSKTGSPPRPCVCRHGRRRAALWVDSGGTIAVRERPESARLARCLASPQRSLD